MFKLQGFGGLPCNPRMVCLKLVQSRGSLDTYSVTTCILAMFIHLCSPTIPLHPPEKGKRQAYYARGLLCTTKLGMILFQLRCSRSRHIQPLIILVPDIGPDACPMSSL